MHPEQEIHYWLEAHEKWLLNVWLRLLSGEKILKMWMGHEMNEKGMESSIPSKLSTPIGHHCNNCQVDFITSQLSGELPPSLVARLQIVTGCKGYSAPEKKRVSFSRCKNGQEFEKYNPHVDLISSWQVTIKGHHLGHTGYSANMIFRDQMATKLI